MSKKIAVLSPHLDDAVLSCADHILKWSATNEVTVVSFFTSCGLGVPPIYSQDLLNKLTLTPQQYQQQRENEDRAAMKVLNVEWQHLGLVDGGFRKVKNQTVHPTPEALFTGVITHEDQGIVTVLQRELLKIDKKYDLVICPLAIGNHVDHVLIKQVVKSTVMPEKIVFYFDAPYFLYKKYWAIDFGYLCSNFTRMSLLIPSNTKQKALMCYTTQMSILFGDQKNIFYPEIVVGSDTIPSE